MIQIALIAIGSGAATALLFASVASGSLLSIFLFYVAPLPILIAALGWSHYVALAAALGAGATLAAAFGGMFFLAFMTGTGLPAWWLGYLAMLGRPSANGQGTVEWYPPGRLVLWGAVFAALVVILGVLNLGTDFETYRSTFRDGLERVLRVNPDTATRPELAANMVDVLVIAIPPAAAVLATITNAANLWLAGKIVNFSGRLRRPWPDLSAITFPPTAAIALAIAIVFSFIGGLLGVAAAVAAAALIMAYGILGFAVLHALTRGIGARPFMIGGAYASVLLFGWPVLLLGLLALADQFFNLRQTRARRGPPALS
jgi:hypothetical protein